MSFYHFQTPSAIRADRLPSHPTKRAGFARAAVFSSFRARDARAINYNGFQDRRPCDEPVRLGHVVGEVVADAGRRALDHWLHEAARTDGEEHETALEIAREIAAMIDVPWAEIMSGEAA